MEIDNRKNEIAHYIGNQILDLRKSKKLSREQFAEKTNLSPNYIYEIEKGNSIPGCLALLDICNTFQIAPANLLNKYLDNNCHSISELVHSDFEKLSSYDKKLIVDLIHFMARLFLYFLKTNF